MHIRLYGGLGNQMFQYAYGKAREAEGETVTFDRDLLATGTTHSREHPCYGLDEFRTSLTFAPHNNEEIQYWQNEKYFLNITEKLNWEFQPKRWMHCGKMKGTAIQIRHFDLEDRHFAGLLTEAYFRDALALLGGDDRVFAFTDGPTTFGWPLANSLSRADDIWIMSHFSKIIISNSSFGWWAAWLGDRQKQVVAPGKWIREGPWDIVPERWKTIWKEHYFAS